MLINQLANDNYEKTYYEEGFLLYLETHLNYFKTSTGIKSFPVGDAENYKFIGDFYGILDSHSIEKKYHYIVMRFNNLKNSNDYKGDLLRILLPDFNQIELLKNLYLTKN